MAANVEKLCTWPSTRRVLLQPARAAARPRSRAKGRVDRRSMARVLPEKWSPCECCRPSVVHDDRRIGTICTTCSAGVASSCGSNALSPSALARPVALAFLKSYRRASSRCEGTMFCRALNMFSTRPGSFFSHSRSIWPTCWRCRFCWLPHRLQAMIGKLRWAAQRAVSFSATLASGRITTCWPSSLTSLGGMLFILPPKNMFSSSVCRMSSRWWPSAILVQPSSLATRYKMPPRRRPHTLRGGVPSGGVGEGAGGLALGDQPLDDAVGVFGFDVVWHAGAGQVPGQHMRGKARLLLVQVHRHQVEGDGRAGAQLEQDVQQRVAVLAAGHADHDFVAGFDHVEVVDGLAHCAAQALFEFAGFAFGPGVGWAGAGCVGPRAWHGVVDHCAHGFTTVLSRREWPLRSRQKSPAWPI